MATSISISIQYADGTEKAFSFSPFSSVSDTAVTSLATNVNAMNSDWQFGNLLVNENGSASVGISKASYSTEITTDIPLSDMAQGVMDSLRTTYGSDTGVTTIQVIGIDALGKSKAQTYNHINPSITVEQTDTLGRKINACSTRNYSDSKLNKTWSANEEIAAGD